MFCTNSTNAIKKQQNERCVLPPIPQDLIQPLRDAIPKIDQALLNSVPEEAIPLCQQLFSAWLSINNNNNNNKNHHQKNILPPRAKSSLNIKSISQYSTSISPERMNDNCQYTTMEQQKQFKKSQSTSKLSSWFSWSIPNKKKNTTITPMSSSNYYKKSVLNDKEGNISEITVTGDLYNHHSTATREISKSNIDVSHINMVSSSSPLSSPSLLLSPSLKSSQKLINQSQRRTFSMMLSKIGIKMGRLKENDHPSQEQKQNHHHHHNRPISAPLILSNHATIKKSSSSPSSLHHHHQNNKIKKVNQKEKINNNNNNDIESLHPVNKNKISQQHPWKVETNLIPPPAPYSTAFDLPQLMNELPPLPSSSLLSSSSSSSNSSLISVASSSMDSIPIQEQILFYRSHFSNEENHSDSENDLEENGGHFNQHHKKTYEQMNRIDRFVDEIKKRKNSLKSSTSSSSPISEHLMNHHHHDKRTTMKMSKTETNLKSEMSVPFIKLGLGRKSIDLDDHIQYHRSISSTSFDLLWQEKFHTQQKSRERIAITLKSISLALYESIQYNHLHQKFNSDTSYVAHPNLEPGKDTQGLFTTIPMTHWRDIFDQLAYVFENGELSAEHAIITMIYIERMLKNSKQDLCEVNWRLIVLAGLIVSIKVWDDCAVYNIDFVQIFPELDIMHINLIERRFLEHIGWDISVGCSLFASTYFELREKC